MNNTNPKKTPKKNRSIATTDRKILWALSGGYCMFDYNGEKCSCQVLIKDKEENILTIGEEAHILPYSTKGPRAVNQQVNNTQSYKNLLVLCPNHHTIIDKDPGIYTDDVLCGMWKKVECKYFERLENNLSENNSQIDDLFIIYSFFMEKMEHLKRSVNGTVLGKEKKIIISSLEKSHILLRHFIRNSKGSNRLNFIGMERMKQLIVAYKNYPTIAYMILQHESDSTHDMLEIYKYILDVFQDHHGVICALLTILKKKNFQLSYIKQIINIIKQKTIFLHPFVRQDTLELLPIFISQGCDITFVLHTIKATLSVHGIEEKVNVGGPVLNLIMQGNDLEHTVFGEALNLLGDILGNQKFYSQGCRCMVRLFNKELKEYMKNKKRTIQKANGIILDYIMLSDEKESNRNLRYEYDMGKRYYGEIMKGLENLHKQGCRDSVLGVLDILSQQSYQIFHQIIINFLRKYTNEYMSYSKEVIFNRRLREVMLIRKWFLQNLIKSYFSYTTDGLNNFITEVIILKDEQIKFHLLTAVPDHLQTGRVKIFLKKYSLKEKLSTDVRPLIEFSGCYVEQPADTLNGMTNDEIVKTIISGKIDTYDLSHSISGFIQDDMKKIEYLLKNLAGSKIDERLIQTIVSRGCDIIMQKGSYIVKLQKIVGLYDYYKPYNNSGALPIIRTLNTLFREEATKSLSTENQESYKNIKQIVIALTKNPTPTLENINFHKSYLRPGEGITIAINSVRGLAVEVLIVLAHYNPNDKELENKILEMMKDENIAVQSNLVYNLKYLIVPKYELCKQIVNDKFFNVRRLYTDFALSCYFPYLGEKKLSDIADISYDIIKTSSDRETQTNLGTMLGKVLILKVKGFEKHIEGVLQGSIGTSDTLEGMLKILLSALKDNLERHNTVNELIGYIKPIIECYVREPNVYHGVTMRIAVSFVHGDDWGLGGFKQLYANQFITYLLKIKPFFLELHHYIIDGMDILLHKDMSIIDECIDILFQQITLNAPIFADSLIAEHIISILRKCFDNRKNMKDTTMQKAIKVFDEGLKVGYDDFYDMYVDYFESNVIDISLYFPDS